MSVFPQLEPSYLPPAPKPSPSKKLLVEARERLFEGELRRTFRNSLTPEEIERVVAAHRRHRRS